MKNQNSIPIDLIMQILSRLPAKSVARFRCVSKLWKSILRYTPYFTELFLTMSSTKPRLLFAVEEDCAWSFFSSPQLPYGKSLVATEFHVKLSLRNLRIYPCECKNDLRYFSCAYASGLIYIHGNRDKGRSLVCNPNTRLYKRLPHLQSSKKGYSFLGFEPIYKRYKVLFMAYPTGDDDHKILTLGRNKRWREIYCCLRHYIKSEGLCINGVLYYLGKTSGSVVPKNVIVCFDLRSEKFTFIDREWLCRLVDYKGKLAMVFWEDDVEIYSGEAYEYISTLQVWVLEDVEKQEWSKYVYTCCYDDELFRDGIQAGFSETFESIRTFVNYSEDLNVNDLKLFKPVCALIKKKRKRKRKFNGVR